MKYIYSSNENGVEITNIIGYYAIIVSADDDTCVFRGQSMYCIKKWRRSSIMILILSEQLLPDRMD